MPGEVIYFISDTHLGDGTGADRFRYPEVLLRLLEQVEAEPRAHLVLLGDFLELWASRLEGILMAHGPIFEALARIAMRHPITYVVGNHDCLPWYSFLGQGFGRVRVVERFTAADGALVALHGHQFDPFNRVKMNEGSIIVPWIRRIVQLMGFAGRMGGERAGNAIATAGDRFTEAIGRLEQLIPQADEGQQVTLRKILEQTRETLSRESPGERGYPLGERIYEDAAAGLIGEGARWVVMGHTHHPLLRRFGGGLYANTGSWVWDRTPPTYVKFAGGRLELLNAQTGTVFEQ